LFAVGGISALSARSIAQTAGVSTISHFNVKKGILDTLFIEGYQMVHDTMDFSTMSLSTKQILLIRVKGYLTSKPILAT